MAASFDARAETYAEAAVVQQQLATWLADWLEPATVTQALPAVEFGAGDGLFTRQLLGRFHTLTATDLSPRMVQRGAQRFSAADWQVVDAWQWPEDDAAPARMYSASLMQWCPDPQAVLRRWRDAAAPGTRMLHGFYAAPTLEEWQSLQTGPPPFTWRTVREWLAHFRAARWNVLRSEATLRTFRFPTAIDLLRFFHLTGVIVPGRQSAGETRAMLRELDRRHAHRNGDSGIPTEWTFLRIEAERA